MGMFDNVQCEAMRCPMCGNPDMDWQTKDDGCTLDTVYVQTILHGKNSMRMIGGCEDCRLTVRVEISRDTSPTASQHVQRMKEQRVIRGAG